MTINAKRTRPAMSGYGLSSDETGMLDWDWVSQRMAQARTYWIGSVTPDGRPHAAPVWGVWLEDRVYFSTGHTTRKGRNLLANPEVFVHLESGDEVVMVEGVAETVTDASVVQRVAEIYAPKYNLPGALAEMQGGLVFVVAPRFVWAWLEADFPTTATRWDFR